MQRRDRLGLAPRRPEQPVDQRDALDRVEHGRDPVRVRDRGLDPGLGDRRQAAGRARLVPRTAQPASSSAAPELPAATAAADDQRPRHDPAGSDPVLVLELVEAALVACAGRARGPPRPRAPSVRVVLGQLGRATAAAVLVLRLDHLLRRRRSRAAPRARASGSASSRPGRRRCPGRRARAAPGRATISPTTQQRDQDEVHPTTLAASPWIIARLVRGADHRRRAHPDRPLPRRARRRPPRRPRRARDRGRGRAHRDRPGRGRRRLLGRREPGRRGQPRRRPDGGAARRAAGRGPGRDRQPALRLRPRGRQPGRRGRCGSARATSTWPAARSR